MRPCPPPSLPHRPRPHPHTVGAAHPLTPSDTSHHHHKAATGMGAFEDKYAPQLNSRTRPSACLSPPPQMPCRSTRRLPGWPPSRRSTPPKTAWLARAAARPRSRRARCRLPAPRFQGSRGSFLAGRSAAGESHFPQRGWGVYDLTVLGARREGGAGMRPCLLPDAAAWTAAVGPATASCTNRPAG